MSDTRKEVLFSDLAACVVEKDRISKNIQRNTWQAVEYETEKVTGVMLIAGEESKPEEVTIPLGLHGWYNIYLGLISVVNEGKMYTYCKLDSDKAFSGLVPRVDGKKWQKYEVAHEIFWKSACLDGDSFHLMHPDTYDRERSALMWIRCVPMSEEEVAHYQKERATRGEHKIHAHIDTDFMGHDNVKTPMDALTIMQYLEGTDVTMCSQEIMLEACGYEWTDEEADRYVGLTIEEGIRNKAFVDFQKKSKESFDVMLQYCKEIGVRSHATQRMEVASFQYPITMPTFWMRFADEHPEYQIKTRDGKDAQILSYAYPEVREFMIGTLVDAYKKGFDGITCLWIRGNSLGFEEPVLKRVAEKYNGLDGRRLPISDERLHSVWCEYMTEFMRSLRTALDEEAAASGREKCNIHHIVFYTKEQNKYHGLDIETWAKEGLADGVTVGMYACVEHLEDCMGDDGLINLDKYKEEVRKQFLYTRVWWMDMELMHQSIEEFEALSNQYGIETFYSVNWECDKPQVYAKEAEQFYQWGAKGIMTWDVNMRVKYPPEWHVTSKLGHEERCKTAEEDFEALRDVQRVLRIGGNDISYFFTNWRG